MKNKVYLFLLLCCMVNSLIANTTTANTYPNEANPSFTESTDLTTNSNAEDLFTDPVINCPSNIVVTTAAGQNTKTVSWNAPTATTPCTVSSGSNCASNNISGFKYLGKFGDSKYYCSDTENFTFWQAKQSAESKGGFLANICSSGVNNFLKGSLLANQAWIGLNDAANEGHYRWVSGSTCGYRNWASGEPNNDHNTNQYHGADHVILSRHDGKWRDRNGNAKYEFIMEIPCTNGTRPGNVTVAQTGGPASGSAFTAGTTTTIRYTATDECGRTRSCSFTVKVNSGGPGDPCANNGGDSDGDGVCDNQDNCRFTANPGQADNDGDGIGNVCDDTPNGNPCANNGGDSDGDGVCDNQDNCRFTANSDQADNDGDGIGNACDDTPNGGGGGGPTCDDVTVSGGDGKVTISNLASGAKVEISGPSTGYAQQAVCEGNCNSMQMVSSLAAGSYNVTVQTFNPYCYKLVSVTVTGGGGGGNPCANQGGDSDGDGICDNQDNCDFNANPDQADNDGDGIGNACDDTPNGGGGGGPNCNGATVSGGDGKVTISNLASGAKVEISGPSTSYGQQLVCEGNCNSMQMISNLGAGEYNVTIQTFNPYCYNRTTVTVTGGGGGGNPCANQGGDSDGDGICDNQDNCDFNANPDQADNDGDGIGNACDDTPNGGDGGGPDCKSTTVTPGDGKVTISNLATGAKVEISGPSTGYGQQLVCEGNCNSSQMVTGLSAGHYNVTVQTFNPYCYQQYPVEITGGGGGNPCANQGGDSDGDGICDNQDNCDFNANPDQADNDGDGIGNACDDTPNGGGGGGPDCNGATVSGGDGKVTISNLASGAKVEISGPSTSYGQQLVCEGNCNSMQMVSGLSAGSYNVTIQTFNPYCYNRVTVTVTGGGGGGNPCANQGGDSDGDGICDNQDNCDFNANPDQADNDGDGIGNACDDTPNGGGGGGSDCNGATVSGGDGKVTVSNLASSAKVEISGPSTGYGQQLVCEGGNCSSMEMVSGLSAGSYNVTIQTFNPYCYNLVTVTVTGGGPVDPCANQGGDSDGDGVCDNQDNCPNTANAGQADNDGDGIGNVCDDTPNGGPTVCVMRTASNTTLCRAGNDGFQRNDKYGGYIQLDRNGNNSYLNNYYTIHDGKFTEFSDGTATFTGRYVNTHRSNAGFNINVTFSGRTRNGSPKDHSCNVHQNSDIYYYATTSGRLNGTGVLAGMRINVSRVGEPFQVGRGGNITQINNNFGASGWLRMSIANQPSNGVKYHLNTSSNGGEGDINIQLTGSASQAFCSAGSRASLTFNAYESSRQVALQWATNTTFKNDHYIIEKSTDGETFEELARVENELSDDDMETFHQMDKQPALGDNYYRVKQVYFDGSFDYTNVELINFNIDLDALEVYPNPVKDELFINLKPFVGKQAHILLTNQYGQIVQEVKVDEIDAAPVRMNIGNIANGMYFLTIQPGSGSQVVTKKLVVDRLY